MVSVCLPSDALLQHILSYLGFSYLGRGVSLQGCSSKVQSLLLTLDEGYLLTVAPSDLEHGIDPLGPPAPAHPLLLTAATREDSTHGHHQMVNTEIRLIISFAAKDGEALYSQQKQYQELTVAQIMNSLLPNSD